MLPGRPAEPLAGVDRVLVLVGLLGVEDFGAGLRVRAVGGAGREQFAVVGFVVVHAGGAGVAAGHLGDHAGEGVGGDGRLGVGEVDAVADQARRAPSAGACRRTRQVGLVQSVDGEQQDVFGLGFGGRRGQDRRGDVWEGWSCQPWDESEWCELAEATATDATSSATIAVSPAITGRKPGLASFHLFKTSLLREESGWWTRPSDPLVW